MGSIFKALVRIFFALDGSATYGGFAASFFGGCIGSLFVRDYFNITSAILTIIFAILSGLVSVVLFYVFSGLVTPFELDRLQHYPIEPAYVYYPRKYGVKLYVWETIGIVFNIILIAGVGVSGFYYFDGKNSAPIISLLAVLGFFAGKTVILILTFIIIPVLKNVPIIIASMLFGEWWEARKRRRQQPPLTPRP